MAFLDEIQILNKQLFPKGRAFKMPFNGFFEKLMTGLSLSESRAVTDSLSIYSNILPDNDDFTVEDASDWERRLGLITNTSVSLSDRKLAIKRKLNHPGDIPARQHYLYVQRELQNAGFDVYVHENLDRVSPTYLVGSAVTGIAVTADATEHGTAVHGTPETGGVWGDCVANSIDPVQDEYFDIGLDLACLFFIGGVNRGDFANVDADRENEFRQLILKVKPAQMVAALFINYV